MRIALDMMLVAPGVAGGRVYCEELIRGLAAVDRENEYLIHTRRDVEPLMLPSNCRQCRAPVSGKSFVWRTIWEYARLPRVVRNAGAAVFHGLGNVAPAVRSCPFVLTIHDMTQRRFPESFPLGYNLFLKYVQPRVARRAARVIVPSRYSAEDVVRYLQVKEERIRVVPYGPGNAFRPITDANEIDRVLQQHSIRRPYLISVARAYAHKNLAGLLRAFARLVKMGHAELQLVLVGERYRTGARLQQLTGELGLTENVVVTGFVPQHDLNVLYSAAVLFAFPSLSEGFGLPLLEAMACGAPVVSSDASVLPEAVGDAGVLADARNPAAFAAALERVLEDGPLQGELRRKGHARVKAFSWERCATETLRVYREVM